MQTVKPSNFAVVADAHYHDMESDYQCPGTIIRGSRLTLRSWADTRRSSRVFNESRAALETTLNDIVDRGIKHVVLLGDYTDDGQIEATERLVKLLRHYQQQFDIAFYAIPGNHDVHGPLGKHQSTRFATIPGETVLVTSSPSVAATESNTSVLTRNMYCEGTPAGLLPMADFGFFRQKHYVHWETPFGTCDAIDSRQYKVHSADGRTVRELMDASYLVEPVEGLWLLMIDANVFEPRNGQWKLTQKKAFLNSSDAGWNAVIRVKPFLIDWIKDVCSRASVLGKNLFTFSHYPIIDPFDDHNEVERKLFGDTAIIKRTPDIEVAKTLSTAGVKVHFGGHLHVHSTMHERFEKNEISDIAVPSLVAFPPCYKIVTPTKNNYSIDTVSIAKMPNNPLLLEHYREESRTRNLDSDPALHTSNHGEFLYKRMCSRVQHHYLPKEWPQELAIEIPNTNAADLARFMLAKQSPSDSITFGPSANADSPATDSALIDIAFASTPSYHLSIDELTLCSMTTLIADWYCLRQAGDQALSYIGPDRLRLYHFLAHTFGEPAPAETEMPFTFFCIFLEELRSCLQRAINPHTQTDPSQAAVT